MKKKKLPFNLGFEFTLEPVHDYIDLDRIVDEVSWKNDDLKFLQERGGVYEDNGFLEWPTPVAETEEDVKSLWNQLMKVKYYYDGILTIDKNLTGGCHINIDIPYHVGDSRRNLFIKNMCVEITNNPWLGWAFQDVYDNTTSKSLVQISYEKDGWGNLENEHYKNWVERSPDSGTSKCYAIRCRYDYFELRFFRMPRTFKELKQNINLVYAIYNKVILMTDKGIKPSLRYIYKTQVDSIKYENAKQALILYLKELKLPVNDYKDRIDSMKSRYELGRKYLV